MPTDLYKVLDVPHGADASEIRKAYLKLSRQYHPDKVQGSEKEAAEAKFKEISHAYEILSDDQKRSFYDQTGQDPSQMEAQGGSPFGGGGVHFPFDIGGLFGMFGGGGGPGRPRGQGRRPGKAPPRKTQIALTLKDYYYGRVLQIHLERQRFCQGCKGEGATNRQACSDCHGSGTKRQIIQMGPMIMENVGPCMTCGGGGRSKGDSCGTCKGSKFVKEQKTLELQVQKGMKTGDVVTFAGESSQVDDYEEAGDVQVELIAADEDHGWERSGDNLVHRICLSFGEALVGKTIRLEGHPGYAQGLYVHIPAGVTNRQDIVIDGCGMPRSIGSGFGDAVLQLTVLATKEERSILETNKEVLKAMFHASGGDVVPEGTSLKLAKPLVY